VCTGTELADQHHCGIRGIIRLVIFAQIVIIHYFGNARPTGWTTLAFEGPRDSCVVEVKFLKVRNHPFRKHHEGLQAIGNQMKSFFSILWGYLV
jgi:hypothetical protein